MYDLYTRGFPKLGVPFWLDYNIFGSILGFPGFGKLPLKVRERALLPERTLAQHLFGGPHRLVLRFGVLASMAGLPGPVPQSFMFQSCTGPALLIRNP